MPFQISNENAKKEQEEQKMRAEWIAKNPNTTEEMPDFEYYGFENYVLRNYYMIMTICAQGMYTNELNSNRK